ncbi:hypothetical protein PUNSTDRAFT_127392 [Punctularia strigosozonata HHB-11173 SS5]|uniref:uncharacterized protein n=1 Tax=Punctularia strigosozonata (strain HHB-11173) TaxID=741275 RepID=UPI0004417E01|nr:uncharacterized protein PUNSTDRAFT_127392 [Punctularia strigosozonata HHB-11173 SS5]EIN06766.1 hypothetical protein PUNSTDRAFT_127392 [Punctularia strigosozonata HHB-11173 SS5]
MEGGRALEGVGVGRQATPPTTTAMEQEPSPVPVADAHVDSSAAAPELAHAPEDKQQQAENVPHVELSRPDGESANANSDAQAEDATATHALDAHLDLAAPISERTAEHAAFIERLFSKVEAESERRAEEEGRASRLAVSPTPSLPAPRPAANRRRGGSVSISRLGEAIMPENGSEPSVPPTPSRLSTIIMQSPIYQKQLAAASATTISSAASTNSLPHEEPAPRHADGRSRSPSPTPSTAPLHDSITQYAIPAKPSLPRAVARRLSRARSRSKELLASPCPDTGAVVVGVQVQTQTRSRAGSKSISRPGTASGLIPPAQTAGGSRPGTSSGLTSSTSPTLAEAPPSPKDQVLVPKDVDQMPDALPAEERRNVGEEDIEEEEEEDDLPHGTTATVHVDRPARKPRHRFIVLSDNWVAKAKAFTLRFRRKGRATVVIVDAAA